MFAALWIPCFRLQAALRHRPALWEKPVAVVVEESVLVEMTGAAEAHGVLPGMTPAQGLARCMELEILPRSPDQERALSELLQGAAEGISPWVEQTAPDVCTADLQGCREDAGRLGKAVAGRLKGWGVEMRVGVAENPDLALLAARVTTAGEPVRVVLQSRTFLHGLPLAVLEPTEKTAAILKGWGIHTLGALARLKRDEVAARLGPEGTVLWDRACGRATRLLKLVRPLERFEETFDFEHELDSAQPLLFMLRRFVEQLAGRLEMAGRVAAVMRITLPLADGSRYERELRIPSPTADVAVLFRMIETHFETIRLESPPTGVRLVMEPVKAEHQQTRLFENVLRDPNRFAETLGRMIAVVGEGRVGVPVRLASHRPDQFVLKMPEFGPSRVAQPGERAVGLPLRRFRPPVPARVQRYGERPQFVVSELVHGGVVQVMGPYRLSGAWWEQGWQTEEWDVQLENGALYRLSWDGAVWQVEGCYET